MVPLSEGRVHDGTLECAYHGWEFDGSGKPVVIPQVKSTVQQPAATQQTNQPTCRLCTHCLQTK